MPSPFPGMDPYLEDPDLWSDVHGTLLPLIRAALTTHLPVGYVAKIDQHVWLSSVDRDRLLGRPDVFVAARGPTGRAAGAAVAEPTELVTLPRLRRRRGTRAVHIIDRRRRRVVTAVELLSPSNKASGSDDREAYLAKRAHYLATGTNLVEIDLLRGGERMPWGVGRSAPADYGLLVARADEYPAAAVWGVSVRESLPAIPVPLRAGDGVVPLNLQECLTAAYDSAEYQRELDYTVPPIPALRPADAEWAAKLLAKPAKKRKGG